ncbi:TonB-dependent receptor plug domain-containing protein [Sphingomonas sp. DT-204]|uniref:TonB-dependent receptor plug domain-containing protein n=1 Tax=Sphingomonas sp. DT-204 TaxID=3396166 RepID=UPI003F1B5547
MTSNTYFMRKSLFGGAALPALALLGAGMWAAPALAQTTTGQSASPAAQEETTEEGTDIVVTGSILRRTDRETPSPVTVLSTATLEERGINTVAEGLQRLSANGSGTIAEGWNNGNNFAAGANAVSLRGLTVQKTLTIFDGLRMAPYPVADDGHRNFVDLSTIPDAVVDRIEVLKDGASSTYGADAVAGVVNVIMKKQITGVHLNASSGISEEGDGAEQRIDLTAGYGDLDEQGFNIYVGGSYRKNGVIWARDRKYPFNSGDLSGICKDGTPATGTTSGCMAIPTRWYQFGVNRNGSLGGTTIPVNPLIAPGNLDGSRTGEYQLLNTDCGAFGATPITLPDSARQLNPTGTLYSWAPNQCSMDLREAYGTIRPSTERYGFAVRATAKIGENAEAYVAGNFMHVNTYSQLTPAAFNNQTPPPGSVTFNPIVLPVYVCSAGVGTIDPATGVNTSTGCDATNGTLNPNNPYAAAGQVALLRGRYFLPQTVETNARSLRGAAGIKGSFGSNNEWNYNVEFTASEVRLERISENYIIPQRLADVIADGSYNFVQPWLNSQEVLDYVAPINSKTSTSNLWQIDANIGRTLFDLPGGPLQVAVGAAYRHESIDDESANPANDAHPYDRYYTINAVGAVGSRNVKSGYFEINAPIVEQFEVNVSGRYDDYSSGQSNFSPKVGAKFRPIQQVLIRGTWSKGFRIPSFNEAYGLPTTGYTTLSINCTTYAEFCASHNNNTYVTGQYNLGRTSTGNPALDPEKSTSWTAGVVLEPIRNVSFTIDYFNIKVKDVIGNISAEDQEAALDAYLRSGNTTAVPGVVVVPGVPDPQVPGARALPGFLQFSFQNADEERVQGIDFGFEANHDFGGGVKLYSSLDASYLIKYEVHRQSGTIERYDGSLSPCDYTSCSGSPKWRGNWQNTLSVGDFSLTGTVYYTDGYDLASVDYGGVKGDCLESIGASVVTYQDGTPVKCKVGAQWNADLAASYRVNDHFTIYANALNFLNIKPQFDPSAAYSIMQYNPAWGQANVVGRYFRIGAKVDF